MEQHRKEEEFVVESLDKNDKIVEQKPQSTAYRTYYWLLVIGMFARLVLEVRYFTAKVQKCRVMSCIVRSRCRISLGTFFCSGGGASRVEVGVVAVAVVVAAAAVVAAAVGGPDFGLCLGRAGRVLVALGGGHFAHRWVVGHI